MKTIKEVLNAPKDIVEAVVMVRKMTEDLHVVNNDYLEWLAQSLLNAKEVDDHCVACTMNRLQEQSKHRGKKKIKSVGVMSTDVKPSKLYSELQASDVSEDTIKSYQMYIANEIAQTSLEEQMLVHFAEHLNLDFSILIEAFRDHSEVEYVKTITAGIIARHPLHNVELEHPVYSLLTESDKEYIQTIEVDEEYCPIDFEAADAFMELIKDRAISKWYNK